ncbi:MAG: PLDc N-terminal domain-containing protein [Thiovulaceae bacterium]|nr:PLDc N-terminal domain-containing protein [Sulfurimonadaceae bacterium]MCW9026663.1 PLDc N-terminal domain-containing protein [Sulfurimonadaceae bacterium]
MSNITITIFLLFVVFWLYTIFSIFRSEFVEKKAKVFWTIGVIFVPFLAFFYVFMKKNLLK